MQSILNKLGVLAHGEGATPRETVLVYGVGLVATAFILVQNLNSGAVSTTLEIIVLALVTLDVISGVVANATRSTNVWYRQRGFGAQFMFLVVHIVHLLVAVLVLDPGNWLFLGAVYLYMLIAGTVVLLIQSAELQRPAAYGLYVFGVIGAVYLLAPAPVLLWFAPVYFAKLIICFAVDHYGARAQSSPANETPQQQSLGHA